MKIQRFNENSSNFKLYLKTYKCDDTEIDILISEEEVNSYKSSNGDRWADFLNPWMHNHDLTILDDKWLSYNTLDKDYLLKIYENKHKI